MYIIKILVFLNRPNFQGKCNSRFFVYLLLYTKTTKLYMLGTIKVVDIYRVYHHVFNQIFNI